MKIEEIAISLQAQECFWRGKILVGGVPNPEKYRCFAYIGLNRCQDRPGCSNIAPGWPKLSQDCPMMASKFPKMALRRPKIGNFDNFWCTRRPKISNFANFSLILGRFLAPKLVIFFDQFFGSHFHKFYIDLCILEKRKINKNHWFFYGFRWFSHCAAALTMTNKTPRKSMIVGPTKHQ